MHLAAQTGHMLVLEKLIVLGANVNAVNNVSHEHCGTYSANTYFSVRVDKPLFSLLFKMVIFSKCSYSSHLVQMSMPLTR